MTLLFFDTSAVAKYYDPAESGHEVTIALLQQFPGSCLMSGLVKTEVLRVFQKRRNIALNAPNANRRKIQKGYQILVQIWEQDLLTRWKVVPDVEGVADGATQLLYTFDTTLKDASDAYILSSALYYARLLPISLAFVSADESSGLNDVARKVGLHVINPDTINLPLSLPLG